MVFADIKKLCSHPSPRNPNLGQLTPPEHLALISLADNKDLIIKTADKGGGVVIMDRDNYIKEAYHLLADTSTYRKLTKDPLPEFKLELNLLVERATKSHILEKSEASFLIKDFYCTPYFYHIPKVHKSLDNPPGRPIIAAIDSLTSGLSKYIDHYLQTLAQGLQSYIRDGTHLLESLSPYTWNNDYTWL